MGDMIDAAFLPDNLPASVDTIAGYLASVNTPGPYHPWTPGDWGRAIAHMRSIGGGWLVPVYLPGPAENPTRAAWRAAAQATVLGQPHGTLIILDREANRSDLDGSWCRTWHDALVQTGYVPGGYTSESTESVFAGWAIRWIARPGPLAVAAGDAITQCREDVPMGTGTVDVSARLDGLPLWAVGFPAPKPSPRPAPAPAPAPPPEELMFVATDGTSYWLVLGTGKVRIPDPAEGSALSERVPTLTRPIPGTLAAIPTLPHP